jgi:hypothetical protein
MESTGCQNLSGAKSERFGSSDCGILQRGASMYLSKELSERVKISWHMFFR